MGRGVRDTEDHCAVLLLGADLGVATYDPRHLGLFSPATRAQLALSRDIADQIQGEGLDAVRAALNACLNRDPQWTERSSGPWPRSVTPTPASSGPRPSPLRQAFDLRRPARPAPPPTGSRRPSTAWRTRRPRLAQGAEGGLPAHDRPGRRPGAPRRPPYGRTPSCCAPRPGISPGADRPPPVQAPRRGGVPGQRVHRRDLPGARASRRLLDEIQWDEDADRGGRARLGTTRPAPGVRQHPPGEAVRHRPGQPVGLSAERHAVTELKTGCTTPTHRQERPRPARRQCPLGPGAAPGRHSLPVMVHPSRHCDELGTAVPGMRVVTPAKLEELKRAVTAYAVALADGQGRWATSRQSLPNWLTTGSMAATSSRPTPKQHRLPRTADRAARASSEEAVALTAQVRMGSQPSRKGLSSSVEGLRSPRRPSLTGGGPGSWPVATARSARSGQLPARLRRSPVRPARSPAPSAVAALGFAPLLLPAPVVFLGPDSSSRSSADMEDTTPRRRPATTSWVGHLSPKFEPSEMV